MYDPAHPLRPTYAGPILGTWLFAPDVSARERAELERLRGRRRDRALQALGGRVVKMYTVDVGYDELPGEPYPRSRLHTMHRAYLDAWESALPLAGLLDLGEIDHHLAHEFWNCVETLRDVRALQTQEYETGALEDRLLTSFDERVADLNNIAEEHRRFHAETSDPTAIPPAVDRVLHDADVLEALRPGRDLVQSTRNLRTLAAGLYRKDPKSSP